MVKYFLVCLIVFSPAYSAERMGSVSTADKKGTYAEVFKAYEAYRKTIWQISPPMGREPEEALSVKSQSRESWVEKAWARWIELPGWFVTHSVGAPKLSTDMQYQFWSKETLGSVWVWEDPGKQMLYIGRELDEGKGIEILSKAPAPAWQMTKAETVKEFYERELATRRIAWKFDSPYLPTVIAPLPMMRMMSGPTGMQLMWSDPIPNFEITFGDETFPGPFTVWQHATGDLRESDQWRPLHWQRERPTEEVWSGTGTAAPHPLFLRASLGVVDKDNDGLDDGFELWYFGDLLETANGDYDQDGFNNLAEYQNNTTPTVADSDADGRKDGEEQQLGTNPLWRDHPDVELEVRFE